MPSFEKQNREIEHPDATPVRHHLPIILILVLGVAASFVMFRLVQNWENENRRIEFESRAKAYTNAVENTLNQYVGALLFLGDYFNHSKAVTRQAFINIVKSILPRYPGIQTFSWNPLVEDRDRDMYESLARQAGFEGFEFTELSETKQLIRAKRREEYVVVYYLHPVEGNRAAFGFDIASNATRLDAIKKGFKTGKLSATERITLVQETGDQFGILMLHPIYQQGVFLNTPEERLINRKGFVVEVLRIGQAIDTALKGIPDEGIDLTLYDMSADEGKRLLHHRPSRMSTMTDTPIPAEKYPPGLFWSKTFDFAERQWKIVLSPSGFFFQSRKIWHSWVVLFGSLLLTTLLAFYMLRKVFYTAEIEQRVKKQAQTNRRLKEEINVRTKAEAERDRSIQKLQQALDEVKILRGIIPICSWCKKIRDDQGYWNQIERYIKDHSEAEFSHGICPQCAKKLYFDLSDSGQKDA